MLNSCLLHFSPVFIQHILFHTFCSPTRTVHAIILASNFILVQIVNKLHENQTQKLSSKAQHLKNVQKTFTFVFIVSQFVFFLTDNTLTYIKAETPPKHTKYLTLPKGLQNTLTDNTES